ncbi:MAG: STAS domain-containing protein [Bacteroidetes bacterium]|nr:STAS domain-containing protein [Bacteroidota bacterium]
MELRLRKINDISVIELNGFLTMNLGEYNIKKTITDLLNNGDKKILFKLDNVEFINSAGIGELVGAYISVTNRGGMIKLCGIPEKVNKMLRVTKVISIFNTYKTEEEAISSFG